MELPSANQRIEMWTISAAYSARNRNQMNF